MAYTVKSGDTLWDIAQRLLGSGTRWRELLGPSGLPADFNPRTLQIGTVIKTAAEAKPAAAPAPTPKPAAAAPAAPTPSAVGPVPVDPGLLAQQWEAALALQKLMASEQIRVQEAAQADVRRLQEAQLGANPADFVAYELYKRSLQEQGFEPTGDVRSDVEIQELVSAALGLEGGVSAGTGQFGVEVPSTGAISRSELQAFSPTDIGVLSSFLRGGVETDGGQFQGINPEDFFTELGEGLIPTLAPQRTQFKF